MRFCECPGLKNSTWTQTVLSNIYLNLLLQLGACEATLLDTYSTEHQNEYKKGLFSIKAPSSNNTIMMQHYDFQTYFHTHTFRSKLFSKPSKEEFFRYSKH